MENREFRPLVFDLCLAVPLLLGIAVGLLTRADTDIYQAVAKPPFAPPTVLFPIVWSLLYTLMGVSLYLVYASYGERRDYVLFFAQLAANLLWPLLFFRCAHFPPRLCVLSYSGCLFCS